MAQVVPFGIETNYGHLECYRNAIINGKLLARNNFVVQIIMGKEFRFNNGPNCHG